MNQPSRKEQRQKPLLNKWVLFVLLAGVALFTYLSIVFRIIGIGL